MSVVPHRSTPLSRATGQMHYHERHLALLGGKQEGCSEKVREHWDKNERQDVGSPE